MDIVCILAFEYDRKNTPIFDYCITGFEYDKFVFLTSTYNGVYGDNAVIDNLNRLIDKTQFNSDKLLIEISSSMTLYENFFPDIKYESISSRSGRTRITVKFENINLEALRRISLSEYVESIHIYSPYTLVVENK